MSERLDLKLPERDTKRKGGSRLTWLLLALVLAAGMVNLVVALHGQRSDERAEPIGLCPDAMKDLALKLEKQGLRQQAAQGWQEYLAASGAGAEERAKIWYRIGKLHQEAGRYDDALSGYYRSEAFAKLEELRDEIGRRTQECLEAGGRFAALRHELAGRVGVGGNEGGSGGEVVAEIGPEKITTGDLDRMIEEQVTRQLDQLAALLPPEERTKQKEAMLQRFSSSEQRLAMLQQFLAEELLYRRARHLKLAENVKTRDLLKELERKVLAQQALEAELAEKIKITPGDVETYFQAHKSEYVQPEQAQISHILTEDEKVAQELLEKLKSGVGFAALAKEHSQDEATRNDGGKAGDWFEKGSYVPSIGYSEDATAAIFSTDAGKVVDRPIKSDKGFHIIEVRGRQPQRQKSLDEVRPEVFRALRSRKEREIREALLAELRQRYDVVIHHGKFTQRQEEQAKQGDKSKP